MTTRPKSPNEDLHAKAPATALLEQCVGDVGTNTTAWREFDALMTSELAELEQRFACYLKRKPTNPLVSGR